MLLAQLEIPKDRIKQANNMEAVNVVEMKKTVVILNSSDSLFGEIRDRNFYGINHVLSRTAKELQQTNEMKNKLNSVSEIKDFVVKTLKIYQAKKLSLENHLTIRDIIKEITLEEQFFEKLQCQNELLAGMSGDKPNSLILNAISRGEDVYMVLRLICLHCIVNNGFKLPLLETYKREILRVSINNGQTKINLILLRSDCVFLINLKGLRVWLLWPFAQSRKDASPLRPEPEELQCDQSEV